jgi:hypothetical protein
MGETNIDFYKGKASRTRLRKLGSFYATLSQPWFQFIDDIVTIKIGHHITDNTYEYHDLVLDLIRTCSKDKWAIPDFDWSKWSKTPEGIIMLSDQSLLMTADAYDIARVLTVILGREHAQSGYLAHTYENGLLLTILHRAKMLSASEPFAEAEAA